MPNQRIPPSLQAWIEARKRHHLSHGHVQMAREIGLTPAKLGKIDNHRQEPWKAPLPEFIEHLYRESFGKDRPDVVMSIEERARKEEEKKAAKREAKRIRKAAKEATSREASPQPSSSKLSLDPPEVRENSDLIGARGLSSHPDETSC
jgi:hypothetical protein